MSYNAGSNVLVLLHVSLLKLPSFLVHALITPSADCLEVRYHGVWASEKPRSSYLHPTVLMWGWLFYKATVPPHGHRFAKYILALAVF